MKRVLISIFICLLSFFLMSHNVSALSNYDALAGLTPLSFTSDQSNSCNETTTTVYYSWLKTQNFNVHGGNMLVAVPFQNYENNNGFDGYIPVSVYADTSVSTSMIKILDAEVVQGSNGQTTLYMLINSSQAYFGNITFRFHEYIQLRPKECYQTGFITDVGIDTVQLQDINSQLTTINNYLGWLNSAVADLRNRPNAPTAQENADAISDEQEQRTQDSSDSAAADAGDSGSDVSSATTNLIGVMSSVVNAITTTQPTNCNIPMGFAHFGLGLVNVCSNVPAAVLNIIRGVSALVFVPIIVNYALYLVNKMIYLFRSFQE